MSCGYVWWATPTPIAESYPGERREREERREAPPAVASAGQSEAPGELIGWIQLRSGPRREVRHVLACPIDALKAYDRGRPECEHGSWGIGGPSADYDRGRHGPIVISGAPHRHKIRLRPDFIPRAAPEVAAPSEPKGRERYKECPGCGQWPCNEGYLACAAVRGSPWWNDERVSLTLPVSEIQSAEELPYPDDVAEAGIPLRPKVSP
jgi:hypothetical protein